MTADWRGALLAGTSDVTADPDTGGNPIGYPGYVPRRSVRVRRGRIGRHDVVAAVWDFTAYGGSFGVADADAFVQAAGLAAAAAVPLVSLVRSGGTRLQEGVAALAGIPRARLALLSLAERGLPHVAVCDAPTTGGIWIGVGSLADVRAGVAGATVGFAGPRVVEATTGVRPPAGSHTAASAYAAGLLDAVVTGAQVGEWLDRTLGALRAGGAKGAASAPASEPSAEPRRGWAQVEASRRRATSGGAILQATVDGTVGLRAPHGDGTVRAVLGRLAGTPIVAVALAADLGGAPTPDGYRLLRRAAELAGRLGVALLTLVDTPGAAAGATAEQDGIAPAIGAAMDAVLRCPAPTLALVHGEGGSGGALAAAVTDRVLVTDAAYFTALGPEGAAAALRLDAPTAADRMGVTPADLLRLGFADRLVPAPDRVAADVLRDVLAGEVVALHAVPPDERQAARRARWSRPLAGG